MTTEEFSNEFDTMLLSYSSESNPLELDEFEKSQFLTIAQEQLVKDLYTGNPIEGFESTEEIRRYLDGLVKQTSISLSNKADAKFVPKTGLSYYSIDFNNNADTKNLFVITYETVSFNDDSLSCGSTSTVLVTPIRHDELANIVKNPFRGPSTSRVLRIDTGLKQIELISNYTLDTYYVWFLIKPTPIILVPLEGDLTIDGEKTKMTSILDSSLHREILKRAVTLAIASRGLAAAK